MKTLSLLLCAFVALAITCQAQTDELNQLPPPSGDETIQQLPKPGDNTTSTLTNTTWKVYGAPVPADAIVYALRDVYPKAKAMIGQKIVLSGLVGKLLNMPPRWLYLSDYTANIEIVTSVSPLPTVRDSQPIQCYGAFELMTLPTGTRMVFKALSIRIK